MSFDWTRIRGFENQIIALQRDRCTVYRCVYEQRNTELNWRRHRAELKSDCKLKIFCVNTLKSVCWAVYNFNTNLKHMEHWNIDLWIVDTEQQNGRFSFKISKQRREKHGMNTLRFWRWMYEWNRFCSVVIVLLRQKRRKIWSNEKRRWIRNWKE